MSQSIHASWLNESYFENILRKKWKNTSIKVSDIQIEPCGAANDGFLSTLLRVRVNYHMNSNHESETFVTKMMSNNELAMGKVGVNGYDVQNKEMKFFELIAPQMEKLFRKIDLNEDVIVKVISIDHEHDVIVFHDLKNKNLVMADGLTGLDEAHVLLGLKKLAKFQAASLVIHKKHPKAFESFNTGMFNRTITEFNDAFLSIFEAAIDEIGTWPSFESYAVKLKKIKGTFIESATRCFDVKPGNFCVLNHGDVWSNNLMFRYGNNGQVDDAILVSSDKCQKINYL